MESATSNNAKILTVSYLILGVLTAVVIRVLIQTLGAMSGFFARFTGTDFVQHVLPVLIGFALFLYLQLNKKVNVWGNEVVVELAKVVWPSRKDTTAMTIVVCVMLLISGIVLGFFDFMSASLVNMIIE